MPHGPRYRRPARRRFEGKTNYHKRIKLLKSRKLRVVIRASNNHTRVQIIQSKRGGDDVMISAFSKELASKYGWTANTGNIPASYLTGYLVGLRAKKNKIDEAIFDLGIFYHKNRVLAACKGIIDAGLQVPYHKEFFPDSLDERINGMHIENYAKKLKSEEPENYEQIFSGYIKRNKINPLKMSQIFSESRKKIENNV
jgi:large subunit ribosomal protein L18